MGVMGQKKMFELPPMVATCIPCANDCMAFAMAEGESEGSAEAESAMAEGKMEGEPEMEASGEEDPQMAKMMKVKMCTEKCIVTTRSGMFCDAMFPPKEAKPEGEAEMSGDAKLEGADAHG